MYYICNEHQLIDEILYMDFEFLKGDEQEKYTFENS